MPFLPNTTQVGLRWAIVGLCLFYLVNFAGDLRVASAHWLYGVLAIGFWLPLVVGLWLMYRAARLAALIVQWALFFLIPLSALSPYAEMDHAFGRTPPPVWVLLGGVLLIGAMNCLAIFYLTKFKAQFRPFKIRAT